jgi:predicted GIY-YIG superfamily endonuclease
MESDVRRGDTEWMPPGTWTLGYSLVMPGSTIRIYLVEGTPLGPRTIEKSNWTGKAFDFARLDWPKMRTRLDFLRPGVYVLAGVDEVGQQRVYVGEADQLRVRIDQHNSGPGAKGFWTRATAFTSRDESFNKAHVRYIESRLVKLGHAAKRVALDNGNAPAEPALSESDRSEAETFLEEMLVIYPLLGLDAFTVPSVASDAPATLSLHARGVQSVGHDSPEGFVVHAGSQAALTEVPSAHAYLREMRVKLVRSGVLVLSADRYVLSQDYTFNSPSTAAGVMLGRSANGRTAWKDALGRSLKDIQDAASEKRLV